MLSPPESGPGTTRRPRAMTTFTRADGRPVRVVPGFRDRVLGFRPSVTPRPGWTAADYERAADKKLARARRLVAEIARRHDRLDRATVLDVGCGDGITCLVLASVAGRRVVRPRGVIHLRVDPYFWLRGCHKRGLVDIPWAHARLSLADFRRFVAESEGAAMAATRCGRLQTLNRLTLGQWRAVIEAGPFEVLEWTEEPSAFAVALLEEYPEVGDSLADGLEPRDLVDGRLEIWLRVTGP